MSHPLASEITQVQDLIQNHEVYMSRLAESEREKCFAFTTSLNMSVLRDIASSALGSECCGIDKIYQGMMEQAQMRFMLISIIQEASTRSDLDALVCKWC